MSRSECELPPQREQHNDYASVASQGTSEPIDVVVGTSRRRRPSWLQEVFARPVFLESPPEEEYLDNEPSLQRRASLVHRMNSQDGGKSCANPDDLPPMKPTRSLSSSFLQQFSLHDDVSDVMKDVRRSNVSRTTSQETLSTASRETLSIAGGSTETLSTASDASFENLPSGSQHGFGGRSYSVSSGDVKAPPKRNVSLPLLSSLISPTTHYPRYSDDSSADEPEVFDTSEVILFLTQGPK